MIKHLEHINFLPFEGYEQAMLACRLFANLADGQADVSLKWDGSPSVFVGSFDGTKPFVATKSFLNKKPIFYTDEKQFAEIADQGLAKKLSSLWSAIKDLKLSPGWAQGDYLFNQDTLDVVGDTMTFTPNTITYKASRATLPGENVGVAWHTFAGGGVVFKNQVSSALWNAPTKVQLLSMRDVDIHDVATILSIIIALVNGNESWLRFVESEKPFQLQLKRFMNSLIRAGEKIDDAVTLQWKLQDWLELDFDKEVEKRSSQKGKDKVNDQRLKVMLKVKMNEAVDMFKAYILLDALKLRFLNRVIPPAGIKAYVGGKEIAHEGCVVRTSEGAVKLVNQQEFSYHNFKRDLE